jgi:hypothetical protein
MFPRSRNESKTRNMISKHKGESFAAFTQASYQWGHSQIEFANNSLLDGRVNTMLLSPCLGDVALICGSIFGVDGVLSRAIVTSQVRDCWSLLLRAEKTHDFQYWAVRSRQKQYRWGVLSLKRRKQSSQQAQLLFSQIQHPTHAQPQITRRSRV